MPTATIEFQLPQHTVSNHNEPVQRLFMYHLLQDGRITMQDALELLSDIDQRWLIHRLLDDAQEKLSLARQVADTVWQQRFWQQYHRILGYLLNWYGQESAEQHGMLASVLRSVARRYEPVDLTTNQWRMTQKLTARLHEAQLYQADIFAATQALDAVGLDTLLDLSPVADQLFPLYMAEIGRA